MATTLIDKRGNQQITISNTETGYFWLDVPAGQHFRFATNSGHGATFDHVVQLIGEKDNRDNAITPLNHVESTGNTGAAAVSVSGRPGVVRVGVNITAFPSGSALIIELCAGRG
jgi:hypothetical protein